MLLGILLHAAITYMVAPMKGLLWPITQQPSHVIFDALFWWIHGWRIPLFFVMAGFFAAMLARRRGPGGFLKHRVLRILIPVIVASVTLLPAMYYLWGWGWQFEGRATFEEVIEVNFRDPLIEDNFIGPAHLWFLNYLIMFSFVYWVLLKLWGNTPDSPEPTLTPPATRCFNSALRPVLFALPTFVLLAWNPDFYLGYHHVLPMTLKQWGYELAQMVYQGWFFVTGVYLFRLHREMDGLKRFAWVYLVLAQVVFACLFMFRSRWLDGGGYVGLAGDVWLAMGVALFCWLMIWGLTGIGLTVLAKPRGWVRWLSDSAYWVYLVHLPIVALLMIVVRKWEIGPWPKFLFIVAVTSVATLVSYQFLVRYTLIGRWLNGPRVRAGRHDEPGDAKSPSVR